MFYSGVWMEAAALPAPGLWPRGSEVMRAGLTAGSETDESRSLVFFLPLFFSFFSLPPSLNAYSNPDVVHRAPGM